MGSMDLTGTQTVRTLTTMDQLVYPFTGNNFWVNQLKMPVQDL